MKKLPVALAVLFTSIFVTSHGQDAENQPPECTLEDQVVTATGEFTRVALVPSVSDPDVDPESGEVPVFTYEWSLPADSTATFEGTADGATEVVLAPVGLTIITLIVSDEDGASSECTATITVNLPAPPEISCSVDPEIMWPPNHKMTQVKVVVNASSEAVDEISDLIGSVKVTSDEEDSARPGDRPGDVHGHDGYTAPAEFDLEFDNRSDTFGKSLRLRAERFGEGDGRVYTIVVSVQDPFGQTAEDTCTVLVPHDRRDGLPSVAVQQARERQEARKARKKARRKARKRRQRARSKRARR